MNDDFTKEQKELYAKPVITILPSYNGEYTIEVHNQDGEFLGRFNATSVDMLVQAIRSEYKKVDELPEFGVN